MIDKFTKWVEAKPLAKIGSKEAIDFIQGIIFCFGVPNSIITDNGTQFTGEKFLDFYDDNNIHVDCVMVAHWHMNGHVERANRVILWGLKPRILTQESEDLHVWLNTRAGRWAAVVPSVLQSLQTMPNRSTALTLFFMVCWAEAVLPTDLQYGPPRVQAYLLDTTEGALQDVVDLLEESRDTAIIRSPRYQQAFR
jgi:hypothetical protein